ncbi:amidase [Pseudomonas sp. S75]|uniref:amidase n=1 Tax=unclassified Pseudomonas TaxID=196821 RepID=UPI001907BBE3|nr:MULTISPECIES: amidase [unclassified Pseudomonas]MBJ9976835.1 amidase [Pseudomonas sp. S30]MBK0153890.1 amidase [Pseudomonas sp. S75]
MKRAMAVLLIALLAWIWHARQALHDFPSILSAYSAKEYCSCRFVMGFERAYCRDYVKQYLPLARLDEQPDVRQVLAEGLGRSSRAAWQGSREGCRLLP